MTILIPMVYNTFALVLLVHINLLSAVLPGSMLFSSMLISRDSQPYVELLMAVPFRF